MTFKIENRILNITNYPFVEEHLEKMASKGWLLTKILFGSFFIYKKIKAEDLDFSISPYELETGLTKKHKKDIKEFQSVCKEIGWNYAAKTRDFHIYFKEKASQALELETDEEEKFNSLEKIGKKVIREKVFIVFILLVLAWILFNDVFINTYIYKSGLSLILIPLLPLLIVTMLKEAWDIRKFLKSNSKNIEIGDSLAYKDSRFHLTRLTNVLLFLYGIILIVYFLYMVFVLKESIVLIAAIPPLIGLTLGNIYRLTVKGSRKGPEYKILTFFVIIVLGFIVLNISRKVDIDNLLGKYDQGNMEKYRLLTTQDFDKEDKEDFRQLSLDISLLVPKSYSYLSSGEKQGYLTTEYAKALNEKIGKSLFKRYIKESQSWIDSRDDAYSQFSFTDHLKASFENGEYIEGLEYYDFTREDFNLVYSNENKDADILVEKAKEMVRKRSLKKDKDNLWDMDQAYFLNKDNRSILIRKGREIYYLSGEDFKDPVNIRIVKDKLKLN